MSEQGQWQDDAGRDLVRNAADRYALLVRGAVPDFNGLHTRAQLFALAARDDVESRLLVRSGRA